MRRYACVAALLLALTRSVPGRAQDDATVVLDLASVEPGTTVERPIPVDRPVTLRITNMIPAVDRESPYAIVVNRARHEIAELPTPTSLEGIAGCTDWEALGQLQDATEEEAVRAARSRVESLLASDPRSTCAPEARRWVDATRKEIVLHPIPVGMRYEVTIVRDERVWTARYSTGTRGSWDVHYGAAFVPDVFSEEDRFFVADSAGSFVVRKGRDERELSFVPATFFSWYPGGADPGTWSSSLGAGIGFDLENPVFLLGWSLAYNRNVVLSAGFAAHKLDKLTPRFAEGDVIGELLDAEQLHEEVYRVNPYVSLTFRFGTNPFSSSTETGDGSGDDEEPNP